MSPTGERAEDFNIQMLIEDTFIMFCFIQVQSDSPCYLTKICFNIVIKDGIYGKIKSGIKLKTNNTTLNKLLRKLSVTSLINVSDWIQRKIQPHEYAYNKINGINEWLPT